MKKWVKISLIFLGSLVLLLAVAALGGWLFFKSAFLEFEGDYAESRDFPQLTLEGFTFSDRNRNGRLDIYEDERQPLENRVVDLLSQMTMEEKIHLLKGSGLASAMGRVAPGEGIPGAVGTIVPTPRLGLPTIYLSDGPAGLRIMPSRENEDKKYYCTAFPIGTLLAATWNTGLVQEVGAAMGEEALEYGIDVILGPGANIHRHPFCGRNFEYFSEDPVLTGQIGAAIVNGIEANGVGTSVKHFVANNQETNRNYNDARISERALREIYLKGFEIIVRQSQPWTIMSSYNKVNGVYASESSYLLTDVLRKEWGFSGLVMSDWFGGQTAPAMIAAGNDLLEPGTKKQWKALQAAQENGELSPEAIDTAVSRILRLVLGSRKMQNYSYGNAPDLKAHALVTRQSASEGMVLLKNEQTLPVFPGINVALLGVTSYDFIAGGTGSGDVNEAYTVSLEEGLKNAGFRINETAQNIYLSHKQAHAKDFVKPEGMQAMFQPYHPPQVMYSDHQLEEMAGSADVAILTIGRNSGEGGDRVETDDFLLSKTEQDLIDRSCRIFHSAGKKVVVVLNVGGVIETASWSTQPDAILLAWQGGQEGGNAVADVLSGQVNPSGKLPVTIPVRLSDHASHANFPLDGEPMSLKSFLFPRGDKPAKDQVRNKDYTLYEEGLYVGYRHFDKAKLDVAYPFGFGLSYTEFALENLVVNLANDSIEVQALVRNTGTRAGKEVVQLYISKLDAAIDRPEQELKAFAKTDLLDPGASTAVSFRIPVSDLSYWDEAKAGWSLEKGRYGIRLGTSSRNIRLNGAVEL